MSYPDSIDSIPQPTPTSPTNNPSGSGVSVAQTNAIVALENKLGITSSLPTAGTILSSATNGNSAWVAPATAINGLTTSNLSSSAGILGSQLSATAGILGSQIANNTITATQIANATITGTQLASNLSLSGTLSTGGFILGHNPVWQYLGYASTTSAFSTTSTTYVQVTGVSVSVTVPSGATAVKITTYCYCIYGSASIDNMNTSIWDGAIGSGTILQASTMNNSLGATNDQNLTIPVSVVAIQQSPTAGSHTYSMAASTSSGTINLLAATGSPIYILVEVC